MSERTADYHYLWVAYTPAVLVLWEHQHWSDGERNRSMLALHVHGSVDTKNVRGIPHRLIASADPARYPRWQVVPAQPNPQLTKYGFEQEPYMLKALESGDEPVIDGAGYIDWSKAPTPTLRMVAVAFELWSEPGPEPQGEPLRLAPRVRDETPDEFYNRVARIYRAFASTHRNPTSSIAELAGVSKQTAARWVHEARKRGHLEQTTRGRVNR